VKVMDLKLGALDLKAHPTVLGFRERQNGSSPGTAAPPHLEAAWLRDLCLRLGAVDVGFVSIDRPEVDDERADIVAILPSVRTLISLAFMVNKEAMRAPARSLANNEYHAGMNEMHQAGRILERHLAELGVRTVCSSIAFPMEVERVPNKPWLVSHKPIAVAAGLGHVGIHRSVIHPRYGSHVVFETVLMDATVSEEGSELDYNPCLECKLCVAACPVGAIHTDGSFDFSACYTHNYREMMGGFVNWVERIAASRSAKDYRAHVSPGETASMWQSLAHPPGYRAGYCVAVCPAGDDVIGPFLTDRAGYKREVLKPLTGKEETIYVTPGSDAEAHVEHRFPHKRARRAGNSMAAWLAYGNIDAFLDLAQHFFQQGKAKGLDLTYHFTFTGEMSAEATMIIRNQRLESTRGHHGAADLHVTVDGALWMKLVTEEQSMVWAILTRRVRLKGPLRVLKTLKTCILLG
jgi:epoxyqueuosine reductase QueG